jgi:hypothetical protein
MTWTFQDSLPLTQRLVWLRVVLSDRFGPDAYERLRRRLTVYLARSGISPVTSARQIALTCTSRLITPFDIATVVAWLVEQPEVVLVWRERPIPGTTFGNAPGNTSSPTPSNPAGKPARRPHG